MHAPLPQARTGRFSDWPLALKSIAGFWLFYGLTLVARAFLGTDPVTFLQNRVVTIAAGIGLTFVIYVVIKLFGGRTLPRKAIAAGVASLIAAAVMGALLIAKQAWTRESREVVRYQASDGVVIIEKGNVVRIERTAAEPLVLTLPRISQMDRARQFRFAADTAVIWLFFFVAWSAFYVAVQAQAEAHGARRRAAEAESAARAAQVRALRYQVNPHFLFNTLNSLSSLVMSGRPGEAEEMILKLSTFYRSSLSLEPSADVTLAEEIELQRLYLDIEKVRFPKRLQVKIDVPDELKTAQLPALLLQPLVENAIKHGVSATRDKVTLRIAAREAGPGRFTLEVSNSGAGRPARRDGDHPDGAGVGIVNVCQRLAARFGTSAHCEFGAMEDGGYRVVMTLPLDPAHGPS